jgi:hypothetical protein
MRTSLALLLGSSLAITHAASSFAQPVDAATKATARQLGEEGMRAFDQGDCVTAADRLSRAHDLVHVPTLAFYAGKCLEKLGRLVDASEKYVEATRDPVDPGAPGPVKAAQADAERARKALVPRIPSVLLGLQPPVPDAVLLLDGRPVPPAMIGVKRPIDPGAHVAEVQRAGGVTRRPFTLQEGESQSLVLDVPPPMVGYVPGYAPPGYAPGYPPGYPGAVPAPPGYAPPRMVRKNMGLYVGGIVLIPVSAIVGIGGIYLVASASANNGPSHPAGGYALLAVGVLGLGGGIAMVAIGGKKVPADAPPPPDGPPPPPSVSFEPLLGPTSAGMRVRF